MAAFMARTFHPDATLPEWHGYAGYFAQLEREPASTNAAVLVGHGTLRASVTGNDERAPDPAELQAMKAIVREGRDAGAVGFSSGLVYEPGKFASTDELVALAAEMVYMMFRFTSKFGIGAVVALIHDVVVTIGAFSVFQWTFDLPALAAVLAVIGYSVNDTVVVADRIRENFRKLRKGTPLEIINLSLTQTLDRTIMTSFTTLLVVVALFLFGGESVRSFSIALIVGIVFGTYSSTYVAAGIVYFMGNTREDLMVPEKENARNDAP
jgi:protein-export SecD/SecF family membrane protein